MGKRRLCTVELGVGLAQCKARRAAVEKAWLLLLQGRCSSHLVLCGTQCMLWLVAHLVGVIQDEAVEAIVADGRDAHFKGALQQAWDGAGLCVRCAQGSSA